MKRVLLVLHHFLPEFPSGVEVYAYHLAQELRCHYEIVLFFATELPADAPEYTVRDGILDGLIYRSIVNRGRGFSAFEQTYKNPNVSARFVEFIEKVQPDVAHVHHLMMLSADILSHLRRLGVPVVFTLHDFWLQCPLFTRLKPDLSLCPEVDLNVCARCAGKVVDRAARSLPSMLRYKIPVGGHSYLGELKRRDRAIRRELENVTLFLGPSRFILDEFIKWGLPREKCRYSTYGHKIAGSEVRRDREAQPGKVRFGYVGSIVPHKGLHVLLEAFGKVGCAEAELHIFGGFYDQAYKRKVLALADGDSRVSFHGRFLPESLSQVYSQFDVQVVPSIWFENSPLTINEAFLNKTPVITANVGGMKELVSDGVNGLTFDAGDPLSLRECLHRFVENPHLIADCGARAPRIKTIEEDAEELGRLYWALSERGGDLAHVPPAPGDAEDVIARQNPIFDKQFLNGD